MTRNKFVNGVTGGRFVQYLREMILHFDEIHNCFSDYTYFEYYATAYINALFNLHSVVDIKDFNMFRVRLIDILITNHCYFDFRECADEIIDNLDIDVLPFV